MTVKVNNGAIVEDTYQNVSDASPVTELYVWNRIMKDFAYSFVNSIETSDDDLNSYIGFLKELRVEGEKLGAIQAKATDFTTDDYLESSGLGTAIPTVDANEMEQEIGQHIIDSLSESNRELVDEDNLQVPLTPDGEAMPLFVASEERTDGGLHTLEDAKEMWDKLLEHLQVETVGTPTTEEPSDNEPEADSESDHQSVNDPTRIQGVGSVTVEKIESNGFEIVPSLDASEHIEVEKFEFEDDSDSEGRSGLPSPSEIKDLMNEGWTKEEIQDFYGE